MRNLYHERIPGTRRTDPGVPSRWLFHYHPQMVAAALLGVTPVHRMTIGEEFMRDHVRSWGPDLLSFPLLEPPFCQFLIDATDAMGVWGPAAGGDYGDPVLPLAHIASRLPEVLTQIVGRHVNPLLRRVFVGMQTMATLGTPRLLRLDPGARENDPGSLHIERGGDMCFMVALNTEYEGGGLDFPRQHATIGELPVGHAVMIPCGPTHPYRALPVTSGVRRVLVFETRSDGDD